ncbi:MAG: DEAD/DEAH box helicase family protein [Kaiparowitsia implicata GSE-PSE-MK54-09C]|jgi:N12 class adenine-specific DNA methylase|nr:DEAD/DEAH box helicase family protein [Kaiparowitsia implicata GSE-PSE-MK54-09C]
MPTNYRIQLDNLPPLGPKLRARRNIQAISLVKELEQTGKRATPADQDILARFSGWGSLPDIFTTKEDWRGLQTELRSLLSEDEYDSARAAILNAHYTSPEVIQGIYSGLQSLGFKGGRILDPSMGATGNFEGLMPRRMSETSNIVGIELDAISGKIAKQLYSEATIHIAGFETVPTPEKYFDLTISNVPFCEVGVADPKYRAAKTLHDYFFLKGLNSVRHGGLLVYITSTGTMQSRRGQAVREQLAQQANLIGALRLPGDAFKKFAGTEVTTDLIILQRLGAGIEPNGIQWTELTESSVLGQDGKPLRINEYYTERPHLMLGEMGDDKLHPGRLALTGDGRDLRIAIQQCFEREFPKNIYQKATQVAFEESAFQLQAIPIPPDLDEVKPQAFTKVPLGLDVVLMQRRGDLLHSVGYEGKKLERCLKLMELRDVAQQVLNVQLETDSDAQLQEAQAELSRVYDAFVKKYGSVHDRANGLVFRSDPDYSLLLALENYDSDLKTATKTPIFTQRTVSQSFFQESAETPKEALLYCLNEKGYVDVTYIGELVDLPENEATKALQAEGLIFRDPKSKQWQTEDDYLSGNVRSKLQAAKLAAETDPQYQVNVDALVAVQPEPLLPGDIDVRLGSAWVPPEDIQDFLLETLDLKEKTAIAVRYSKLAGGWGVHGEYFAKNSAINNSILGTSRCSALRLVELALNLKNPVVYDTLEDRQVINRDETAAARLKQEELKVRFKDWIWQSPERTERLTKLYNQRFNTFRPRIYNGAHLTLPGANPTIQFRPHQKNAIWRTLQEGNTLLAHCVGAGKTFAMIASAMEGRRLGLAQKPMIIVPNHLLEQWAKDWKLLYPNANILAADKTDSSAQNRAELTARIATGDWDAVIVTHSAFGKLRLNPDTQKAFYKEQIDLIKDAIAETGQSEESRAVVKQLERQRKRLQKSVDGLNNPKRKDNGLTFEQLGVDLLIVDEAHMFKNLGYTSQMNNVAGLPNTNSDRAMDLYMKARYLAQQHGEGKGLVFATATPIANTMAEVYTMQRYLQPQLLEDLGLSGFDAWASTFGETVTAPEISPAGSYRVKTRFARFVNVPELMNAFRQIADIQTKEMLNLPTPSIVGGKPEVIATLSSDLQLAFTETLAKRAENISKADPRSDNMLLITTEGRKSTLDMRLINPHLPHERNKVDAFVEDSFAAWQESREQKSTHLAFCYLGTPKTTKSRFEDAVKHFSVYEYIKTRLVEMGMPADQIVFAQDAKSDAQKLKLQQKFNSGDIHLLISGQQLETGFNGQQRLKYLSTLTPPWRPDQIEQAEGRALRQGNQNESVVIRRYVTQGRNNRPSFDGYNWQTLESKKKSIDQIMAGNSEVRSVDDLSDAALTFAEVKAIATGNPLILEKAEIDNQVSQLSSLKRSHLNTTYRMQQQLSFLPARIQDCEQAIPILEQDTARIPADFSFENFSAELEGLTYYDPREFAKVLLKREFPVSLDYKKVGSVAGFEIGIRSKAERSGTDSPLCLQGAGTYYPKISHSYAETTQNIVTELQHISVRLANARSHLNTAIADLKTLSGNQNMVFPKEAELQAALTRQHQINMELGLYQNNAVEAVEEEAESSSQSEDEESNEALDIDDIPSQAWMPPEPDSQNILDSDSPSTSPELPEPNDLDLYNPTLQEMRNWAMDALVLGHASSYLARVRALATEMLQGTDQADLPSDQRDPNFTNPNFTLSKEAVQAMHTAHKASIALRSPSLDDLRQWYVQAAEQGQTVLLPAIAALGKQMKKADAEQMVLPYDHWHQMQASRSRSLEPASDPQEICR